MVPVTADQNSRVTAPFANAAVADVLEVTGAVEEATADALRVLATAAEVTALLGDTVEVAAALTDAARAVAEVVTGAAALVEED
ncbi:MAG: hypothetical protein ACR2JY_08925 [Chloroflexota bacterium]